jgi:hypothetical protein
MGSSTSVRDRETNVDRLLYVMSSDELLHKMAGNDLRNLTIIKEAIENYRCQRKTEEDDVTDEEIPRICVLLTTIIDFCGFRFQVFCPVNLDEQVTLVYGSSGDNTVFVNSVPHLQVILKSLAKQLNIQETTTNLLLSSTILNSPRKHLKHVQSDILSKDMQIHYCDDKRLYALNFNGLYPADMPRPESHDTLTRLLRPEFVAQYKSPLSGDTFRNELMAQNNPQRDTSVNNEAKSDANNISNTESLVSDQVKVLVAAGTYLQEVVIPSAVNKLDLLTSLPIDSYSLTEFLHCQGINMRYLGSMYKLSKCVHVRSLLLTEAVGRSCKLFINQTLRNIARRGRGESLVAEQRQRSKIGNFVEHQGQILVCKRNALIDIFNIIFGAGPHSTSFWESKFYYIIL